MFVTFSGKGCRSTRYILLHGDELVFTASGEKKSTGASQPKVNSTTAVDNASTHGTSSTSGLTLITDIKVLLQAGPQS